MFQSSLLTFVLGLRSPCSSSTSSPIRNCSRSHFSAVKSIPRSVATASASSRVNDFLTGVTAATTTISFSRSFVLTHASRELSCPSPKSRLDPQPATRMKTLRPPEVEALTPPLPGRQRWRRPARHPQRYDSITAGWLAVRLAEFDRVPPAVPTDPDAVSRRTAEFVVDLVETAAGQY